MPKGTAPEVLRVSRTFAASPERVFAALTEPELLKQWWGPGGFSLPTATVDLRVGGSYRFGMQPPQGEVMWLTGTFKEIRRPSRLVYTWAWESAPQMETVVTIELREASGATEVLVTQERFPDAEATRQHLVGWEGGFDRLDKIFGREKHGKT